MSKHAQKHLSIPQYFSKVTEMDDVMDAFLTQFAFKIAKLNEKLINSAIDSPKLNSKKKIEQYQTFIYTSLEKFNSKTSSILTQISTFSSLAASNPPKALESILGFCPVVLGSSTFPNETENTLLSFFPQITGQPSDLAYIIGYFSDCVFSILATTVFQPMTAPDESVLCPVLDRLFKREQLPPPHSFEFKIFSLALKSYTNVVKRICRTSFLVFSSYFKKYFPTKNKDDSYLMSFLLASSGILFTVHDFLLISEISNNLLKLFLCCSENDDVLTVVIEFFCNFIPNIKDVTIKNFVGPIERRAESLLKTVNFPSAMKLLGVIHYIHPHSNTNKKYLKFVENRIYKNLSKKENTEAVLDYLISYLKPSENVTLNWSPHTSQFVTELFQKMIDVDFTGVEEKASILIEYMAAIDLPGFISKSLPQLLDDGSSAIIVTLYSLIRILNPMSGFQEIAMTVPTNATVNIRFHLNNIVTELKKFMHKNYLVDNLKLTSYGFDYISATEVLETIPVPSTKQHLNQYDLQPQVLYFLLILPKYNLIRPLPRLNKLELEKSENICREILKQWENTFETPYDYFGDVFDSFHLPLIDSTEFTFSKDICLVSLIPIVFHFSDDYTDISSILINMILSDCVSVAVAASVVYEILCISFHKDSNYLLNELYNKIKTIHLYSASQMHQLLLTFLNCLKCSTQFLGSSIVQIKDIVGCIALHSPYPETRLIGLDIIRNSPVLSHIASDPKSYVGSTFKDFLDKNKSVIELKTMVSVLSSYSSLTEDNVPSYKLPTIQLRMICLSPFLLIWKFSLIEISKALQNYSKLAKFVISFRSILIENANFFVDNYKTFIQTVGYNELNYFSNTYLFLVSTLTSYLPGLPKENQTEWIKQNAIINKYINGLIRSCFKMKSEILPLFSFVFQSVHPTNVTPLVEKFILMLEGNELNVGQKDKLLELMSLVLRKFSMQSGFNDYLGNMIQSRLIDQIFRVCDQRIQLFTKIDNDLPNYIGQLTDYLVFRGQYFKYLHQTRLENPHGPIPRVAFSTITEEIEISPVIKKIDFFNVLLKWSLLGEDTDSKIYRIFGHVSRTALVYLVSLVELFDNSQVISLDFLSCFATIASYNPAFLKHLLTHHFHLLFDSFLNAAFTSPLDIAVRFFKAIASQFCVSNLKDSLIYSHDTFLMNKTTVYGKKLTTNETDFVNFIYLRTGKIILLSLFYLFHSDLEIRQSAMKFIAEIIPIIVLIHNKGQINDTLKLFQSVRKHISLINSNITQMRTMNISEFSMDIASASKFCTEQFLYEAFNLMPKIPSTRKSLTRNCLLQIISPWMKNIKFDLVNRYVIENPCRFFVFFSPTEFVTQLCRCTATLPFDLEMWGYLVHGNDNIEFLILALIDYVISEIECKNYILNVLKFIYRVDPIVTINAIVPYLQFENWYFQTIQLGQFEEMTNFNQILFGNSNEDDSDEETGEKSFKIDFHRNSSDTNSIEGKSVKFHRQSVDEPFQQESIKNEQSSKRSNSIPKSHSIHLLDINSNTSNVVDGYLITTELALDAITLFANDDVVYLFDSLAIIVSFCLTHLKMKKSLICLAQIVESLKNSYDIDVPRILEDLDIYLQSILKKNLAKNYQNEMTRSISIDLHRNTFLFNTFFSICISFDKNYQNEIVRSLLTWSLACGDLECAAISLDFLVIIFKDKKFLKSIQKEEIELCGQILIENMSLVLKCLLTSQIKHSTVKNVGRYLNSIMKTFCVLFESSDSLNELGTTVFEMAASIFDIDDNIFIEAVISESLKLLSQLIQKSDIHFQKANFTRILLHALISSVISVNEILSFMEVISNLPKNVLAMNGNLIVYLTAFLPSIFIRIGNPEQLNSFDTIIKHFAEVLDRRTSEILVKYNEFPASEKNLFATQLLSTFSIQQLNEMCSIFSQIILKKTNTIDEFISIYELSSCILEICHNSDVLRNLQSVASQALLYQKVETIKFQSNLIELILNSQLNISYREKVPFEFPKPEINPLTYFSTVYTSISSNLHLQYKNSKKIKTDFSNSILKLPPMVPFEKVFLKNKHLEKIFDLLRTVEVLPFTNRASFVYKAQNFSDILAENKKPLKLALDLPFQKIIDNIIQHIQRNYEDEEEEETCDVKNGLEIPDNLNSNIANQAIFMTDEVGLKDLLNFVSVDLYSFLPNFGECNQMANLATRIKLQPIVIQQH